jgi:hypothetical protein
MNMTRRRFAAAGLLALALIAAAAPVASATPTAMSSAVNARKIWTTRADSLGWVYAGRPVDVICWHDGGSATITVDRRRMTGSRWFMIETLDANGQPTGFIGFVTTLAIQQQPRVPVCVPNAHWQRGWAADRSGYPPQPPAPTQADLPCGTLLGPACDGDPSPSTTSAPPSDPTTPAAPSAPAPSAPAPSPPTYAETVGGVAHTWTNPSNAGGYEGPTIGAYWTVQIACKLQGFRVADGNTWWYRIASSPWNSSYYVSADAFYNNGQTSGSLHGTPFVDPAVADC